MLLLPPTSSLPFRVLYPLRLLRCIACAGLQVFLSELQLLQIAAEVCCQCVLCLLGSSACAGAKAGFRLL